MKTRREILKAALLGAAVSCTGAGKASAPASGAASPPKEHDDDLASAEAAKGAKAGKADKPLKILILGGTGFIGPHLVEYATARGHTVTLFNRGKTRPELFPEIEKLRGDRDGKLEALKGRKWDAVLDPSGYVPRIVKMSAELLAPNVSQYLFVSSISVFPDDVKPGATETNAVQQLTEPGSEDYRSKHYGALKALSEQAAEAAMPGRTTVVRPGLIVGPGDPTDRYTYWPIRVDRGGEMIGPNDGSDPAQFVDARDLTSWMIRCLETKTVGVFNATGPARKLSIKELIESCGGQAKVTWIPEKFLAEQKVEPWSDLPVWTGSEGSGFSQIDCRKAIAAGLEFRSEREIARDTLAWWKTLPEARRQKPKTGLSPEREQAILSAWKAKR